MGDNRWWRKKKEGKRGEEGEKGRRGKRRASRGAEGGREGEKCALARFKGENRGLPGCTSAGGNSAESCWGSV